MKITIKRSTLISKKGKVDISNSAEAIRMNDDQLDKVAKIILEIDNHQEEKSNEQSNSN